MAAAAIEHPNVIPIHDYGECHGRAVHRHAVRRRRRPARAGHATGRSRRRTRRAIVAHVADALDAAHAPASSTETSSRRTSCSATARPGLPHRLRPREPRALRRRPDRDPAAGSGTMDFMAPEQIRGERVDRRADVYALGCVLHFALTGQVAYPRETDEARLWAHLHAGASRALAARARACRQRSTRSSGARWRSARRRRPASAGELGARPSQRPGTRRSPGPSGRRRRRRARSATSATWPDGPAARRRRPVLAAAAATAPSRRPSPPSSSSTTPGTPLARPARRRAPRRSRPPPAKPPGGKEHVIPAPHVVRAVHVGARPVNVEVAAGSAWVASTGSPDARPGPGRRPPSPPRAAPRLRHHRHHRPAGRAVGHGGRLPPGRPVRASTGSQIGDAHRDGRPAARHRCGRGRGVGRRAVALRRQPRRDRPAHRHGRGPPGGAGGHQRHPRGERRACGSSAATSPS